MPLPTVILPGYFARRSTEYQSLKRALNERGIPTITVPLRKRDWVLTLGGRSFVAILQQIDRVVKQTMKQYNTTQVN